MEQNTFICLLIGFLGVLLHCFIKVISLMEDAKRLKINFTVKDYITKDFAGISISLIVVIVWLLVFPEVATARPNILNFVRISFGAIGLFGSVIIQAVFNKGKKYIRNKIGDTVDEKEKAQAFADTNSETPIVGDRPKDR